MEIIRTKPVGVRGRIAYFFRQTFRHHSGAEFSELLTRGISDKDGLNRQYPWAYLRAFAIAFILFAVYLLIVRFVSEAAGRLFAPTITVIAAVLLNIPFLLLIFELYPKKDLSFLAVALVMLFGGAVAHIIAQILYDLFPTSDLWVKAVLSGVFEELPKALATIISILVARKRSPLAGFVLGAAVGCGFSLAEDMGHIFLETSTLPVTNLNALITVSVERAVSSLCTHILWTAAIGWSYNLFNKWISNAVFYLMVILTCGLHIAWDLPLDSVARGLVCASCAVVAVGYTIAIFVLGRRSVYRQPNEKEIKDEPAQQEPVAETCEEGAYADINVYAEAQEMELFINAAEDDSEYFEEDSQSLNASTPLYWTYWGRLAVFLGAFLMSVIAVIYCSISFPEVYGIRKFKSPETLIEFMQDGLDLKVANRPYDPYVESEENNNGTVVQSEIIADGESGATYTYYYEYSKSKDVVTDREYYFPLTVFVEIKNGNETPVTGYKENLYDGGKLYATFFHIRKDVTNYTFDDEGDVTVYTYDPGFVRDLREPRYMWLFGSFAALFGASVVCYAALKIKSWRVKKLCLTRDVSSAES